ncbi:hypothetical protein PspLS_11338 [Pyricularia sp. CBS 133598]|nr:hypothetical protein PspLS_11338 [Pyricularia sp. CBS 133598]
MSNAVWLTDRSKTVEGHNLTCALYFDQKLIWGPMSCHNNTTTIQSALREADPRIELRLGTKDKTVEGHTKSFNIKCKGKNILEDHSCHNNLEGLVTAITALWTVSPPA